MLNNGRPFGFSMIFNPHAWATTIAMGPQTTKKPLRLPLSYTKCDLKMEGKSMQWFSWSNLQITNHKDYRKQAPMFFPCNDWTFGMVCKCVKHFNLHNCQPNVSQNHCNHHNCGNCWCLFQQHTQSTISLLQVKGSQPSWSPLTMPWNMLIQSCNVLIKIKFFAFLPQILLVFNNLSSSKTVKK
jgi:hypothetical protein